MHHDLVVVLLVLDVLDLFFQALVLLLQTTHLLVAHRLLLVQLLVVALVFDRSVFFEGSPLVLQLGDLFLKTFLVHSVPLPLLYGFRKFSGQF